MPDLRGRVQEQLLESFRVKWDKSDRSLYKLRMRLVRAAVEQSG
jgi:hypothetical protein